MRKVALKDIARKAGVSTASVSYVLNDQAEQKRVSHDVAQRIRAIAKQLNYRPNQIARSLKIRKTHTLGLVVANINYRFTTGITSAIESEAKKNGYTVIFGSSDESADKFNELVNVLINRQVDGLILIPVEGSEPTIQGLISNKTPFVLVDRTFPNTKASYIGINNFSAAYRSIKHLTHLGKTRIGLVNYKTSLYHLRERDRGYRKALQDAGIKSKPEWHREINDKHIQEDVKEAIKVLVEKIKVEAIFFGTDTLAIHGLKMLNTLHKRVPEDISVVSFDASDAFDLFYCPITHAKQPLTNIGITAVDALLQIIEGNNEQKEVLFESDFIVGKSCGE